MKRWIRSSTETKPHFNYPESLNDEKYRKIVESYSSHNYTCVSVCNDLAETYSNLASVTIGIKLISGGVNPNGHRACLITDASDNAICSLIDPTGDQYNDVLPSPSEMQTWCFHRQDNWYLSLDHEPVEITKEIDDEVVVEEVRINPELRAYQLA